MPLWFKIWPLNGCSRLRAKQNLLRRRKRVHESFSSRQEGQKSFILTNHSNSEKHVKIYPGIIVHQRLTVPKQKVMQNTGNRHCERRNIRGTLLRSGLDEKWCADSGNVTVNCETFKTSCQIEKLFLKGDLENLSVGQ